MFTRAAAEDVVAMWRDDQFQDILGRSLLWASEEVLLPSLVALAGHEAWLYEHQDHGQPWIAGATFCYRRSLWEHHPFADTNDGSDTGYLFQAPAKRVGILGDASFYVALLHGDNTNSAPVEGPTWRPCPPAEVAWLMGEDWAFYRPPGGKEPSSL